LTSPTDTPQLLTQWRRRLEERLDSTLPAIGSDPDRLHQAMRYSAQAEGKRIRPLLTYAAGHALGLDPARLDALACAVELIHAYSLIHDDLPAMDDDSLRRGRPTCHLAFDEATAILAGDALQALAFESLAGATDALGNVGMEVVLGLAEACGSTGMAGGQMLDLSVTGRSVTLEALERIHRLKTGALIRLAVTAPAQIAESDESHYLALDRYGECVGLGFQIRDDILDVTGDADVTGKSAHADAERNQPTFPSLIGLERSIERAEGLRAEARDCLDRLGGDTAPLAWLADFMIRRDR